MTPIRIGHAIVFAMALMLLASRATAQDTMLLDESFDSVTVPALPGGWRTSDPERWVTDAFVASPGSGGANLQYEGDRPAYVDTPVLDFSRLGSGTIRFFARRTYTYPGHALVVRASKDGGATFPVVLVPSGAALPAIESRYEEVTVPIPPDLIGAAQVVLRFEAAGGAERTSGIRIDDVEVSGTLALLTAVPGRLTFTASAGAVQAQTVQLTNQTPNVVTVEAPVVEGAPFSITPANSATLTPGQSRTYTVTFAPGMQDVFHGAVTFQHSAGTTSVMLMGVAGANTLGFSQASSAVPAGAERVDVPMSLAYGNATGLQGLQFAVAWNSDALRLAGITRGSAIADANAWTLESNAEVRRAQVVLLGSGSNALPSATYDPLFVLHFDISGLDAGAQTTVEVTMDDVASALADPSGDEAAVSLGTAVHTLNLARPQAFFRTAVDELDFGPVEAGQARSVSLVVNNTGGTRALTISGITASNERFTIEPDTATIPPDGAQTFVATFFPTWFAFGRQSGAFTFVHDGEGGETAVPVRGFGHSGQGDATADGMVDVLDLVYLVDYILQRLAPSDRQRFVSDVYPFGAGDGRLDVQDATVLSYAVARGQWPDGQALPPEITPVTEDPGKLSPPPGDGVSLHLRVENGTPTLYLRHQQPIRAFQLVARGLPGIRALDGPPGVTLVEDTSRPDLFRLLLYRYDARPIPPGEYAVATLSAMPDRDWTVGYATAIDTARTRIPVDVKDLIRTGGQEHPDLPLTLRLDAPYPNPFHPAAGSLVRISAAIAGPGRVTLSVFDVLGRHIRVLHDARVEPGALHTAWDGRDANGRIVAPGLYLVRLNAESGSAVKTVVVLR